MKLFDVHTHVQFAGFQDDWKEVIDRSLEAGVYLMNVGTQKDTSAEAVKIANMYDRGVYAAVGLHPIHTSKSFHDKQELGGGEEAKEFTSRGEEFDFDYYEKLAKDAKVLAIGECGLDYYRGEEVGSRGPFDEAQGKQDAVKQRQKKVFEEHIRLADSVGKALMVHCRPSAGTNDAYEDLLKILQSDVTGDKLNVPVIIHFYVGSKEMTEKFVASGYYFSLGGVNTFTNDYHESIKAMPMDRILLETDAPYVAPVPYRGKRNEPSYIVETAKVLAEIVGMPYDKFAKQAIENTKRALRVRL
ncbi:MAG: TatD family hydrolase [Candidatus Levybacteria bacterium]|nr:TatD family hydrolase [Candidatus Levybacteria bacterium]